jgi:glycosyltransferase involved in cell wall biosynthesis
MSRVQVSIVTIFFNAETFLAEAIRSVLTQTYRDWELLLVDDGSTDRSGQIAQEYACHYPDRIRYFEHYGHQNLGKSTSRNLGLFKAVGQYVAFLDADDVFLPHKLARQVAILEAHPTVGMVYGRTQCWYGWTGKPSDLKRDTMSKLGVSDGKVYQPPFLMTRFLKKGGTVPYLCALLARRAVIERLGAFDESIQQIYEDQVLIAKLCTGTPIFVDGVVGERYRQHEGSSCAVAIRNREYHPLWPNPARRTFLIWLAKYLHEKNIEDSRLDRALHQELRASRYLRLYTCWTAVRSPVYLIKELFRWIGRKSQTTMR